MIYAPCGLQRRGWVLTYCMRMTLCKGKEVGLGMGMGGDGRIVGLKCDYLSVGTHHYDLSAMK
jgi:hypothetical protein